MTVNEAAKLLRRHRVTVLKYVKAGVLTAMRHPNHHQRIYGIRLSQLNLFIQYLEQTKGSDDG